MLFLDDLFKPPPRASGPGSRCERRRGPPPLNSRAERREPRHPPAVRYGQLAVIPGRVGERVNRVASQGLSRPRAEPRYALKGHTKGNQSLAALDLEAESTKDVPVFASVTRPDRTSGKGFERRQESNFRCPRGLPDVG